MAIIYSYPEKLNPAGGDFLVITDSAQAAPNKNRTKSLTIDNLASYVITSQSAITGSGTLDTIPIFTGPNTIGDSFMTYNPTNEFFTISKRLKVDGDLIVDGRGNFNGDYLRVNCPLQDGSGLSGTAGQFLSSTGTGVEWVSDSVYSWNITGDNGTSSTVTSGNTVDIAGGTNITTAADLTDKVTINLDDSITLAGTLTVNGTAQSTFAGPIDVSGTSATPTVFNKDGLASVKVVDFLGTAAFAPNAILRFGGLSAGLSIYQDDVVTGDSIISDTGPGNLRITGKAQIEFRDQLNGDFYAIFNDNGAVNLYHNNVKKFETNSNSIKILDVPVHADNAAASAAGLTVGEVYRTGDLLKIVH